jgi:phasin
LSESCLKKAATNRSFRSPHWQRWCHRQARSRYWAALGAGAAGARIWHVRAPLAAGVPFLLITQAKESYGKITATTAEATDLIKNGYSTALKGAQDYNDKLLEFAQTNTKAALDFAQRLMGVKSPSEFIELLAEHARTQFEALTEQTRELVALGQKVTLATTEPLKANVAKVFSNAP